MKDYMILGYATNDGLKLITKEDANKLTHINLAFGVIRDGVLSIAGLPDINYINKIREFNPNIKFILSVGGWTAGGFSIMAMTKEGRAAFVNSAKDIMQKYELAGIDIDWEYPCNGSAGIDYDPKDKQNFTYLLQDLRDMAGERIVSIAAGSGAYFIQDTEMEKVGQICDYVQLMTYDMRSGSCTEAGHHTSLFASKGDKREISTKTSVDMFTKAGVPHHKLIIGAAFYSRHWTGVPDVNHGLLQQAQSIANFGPGYSELHKNYINKNGWIRYWDDDAKAPYLFNGSEFLTYDDPESIAYKCEYVKQEGLLGIMYWEHSCDDTHTLLDAMYRVLK